ncbi:hypothetical protein IV203_013109 [Nitzschia inconspicua]|uniref:Transmembrane protein n=1 Tax=Nitzschia inconspicua TaxID=303405 RepID=A0A9K3M4J2_9STRA|nr:hypothetical protein IV203_013109 [Nitzschia inconspicua]
MSPTWWNTNNSKLVLAVFVALVAFDTPRFVRSMPSRNLPSEEAAPPLNCDALVGTTTVGQHNQSNNNSSNNDDGGDVLLETSEAPSDAPSAALLCSDRLSNARGVYTSAHVPCTIKFHSVTQFQREEKEKEVDFIDYRTSNLCREGNVIVEIWEYLENFPDECVGDFDRCYSLEHHSKYLYPFLCPPDENSSGLDVVLHSISHHHHQPRWELPPGTTHVSVDCTSDRKMAREEVEARAREERQHNREVRREEIGMKLFNWVLVFLSSIAFIHAVSHFIVTPLASMVAARRERRKRRRRSSRSCRRSRTIRTSSTLSSSYSTLPLHHQDQDVTVIAEDGVVVEGYPQPESNGDDPSLHHHTRSVHRDDEDADNSASSTSDGSYETVHDDDDDDDEQRQMNDFDSQVPCDFDAVPIVAATILSSMSDAIPATVVQDGVSYS